MSDDQYHKISQENMERIIKTITDIVPMCFAGIDRTDKNLDSCKISFYWVGNVLRIDIKWIS